eukprot:Gb_27018 [translate_table: standard]
MVTNLLKVPSREVGEMEYRTSNDHKLETMRSSTVSVPGDTCLHKGKNLDLGCLAPGYMLWAKMNRSSWWPAQIVDERTVSEKNIVNQKIKGGVLIRFYGSYDFAWVDPLADLSQFEESFKEPNCNPLRVFQKALEEVLLQNKLKNTCKEQDGRSGDPITPPQHDQSDEKHAGKATSCKRPKATSCKRPKVNEPDQSRSQKRQKEKISSTEEEIVIDGSGQKVRQMRVMRRLGLAAPPGSPFSVDSPVKVAA